MEKKVVLITGASSGIGKTTAQYFAGQGYQVFGTSRHPHADFAGVTMFQLDVTSDESVKACVEQLIAAVGRIDVLINNAGITYVAAVEETSIAETMPIYETNYFGAIRMTQAVLPYMRTQKRGHIIGVSSFAARVSLPTMSAYSATKAALVALYTSLHFEVAPWGIKVSVVEPGSYKSDMGNRAVFPEKPMPHYDQLRQKCYTAATDMQSKAPEPDKVAEIIFKIAQSDNPRIRYLIGRDVRIISMIKAVLPEALFKKFINQMVGA